MAAVVGIDGCGKSSAWRGALERLAPRVDVVGIGDDVLAGSPGVPVHARTDLPLQRPTSAVGRAAKRARNPWVYRQLKALDLMGRSRMGDHVVYEGRAAVLLTDGDPLVNTLAWSIGHLYRSKLAGADRRILDVLRYLSGEERIPRSELGYYLRNAPQLALVDRLGIARFRLPDLVVLLRIDGPSAMERIRRRGRPLQGHETEATLGALAAGYERICSLIEAHRSVRVVRAPVTRIGPEETAALVTDAVLEMLPSPADDTRPGDPDAATIDVVATTISGSLRDQRKVGRIGPALTARTRRPVRVHVVDSHADAESTTRQVVSDGGRIIVSAGGGGTFNAVLEGCHVDGRVPGDVRLAFLRKGSADLIGKTLRISDELPDAVAGIVDAIERDRRRPADVIEVASTSPDGAAQTRHMIGFGGLGIFGDVPRFTEARWVRLYKGVLGSVLGDYGPFYAGLALATTWWLWRRARGRLVPLTLELDGTTLGPDAWIAVIVVGGDLGPDFPLGRGCSFSSGTFRVVALRDRGLRVALRQLAAARSGSVLDVPDRYHCVVHDASSLVVTPSLSAGVTEAPYLINVDGLSCPATGQVRFAVRGRVELLVGPPDRAGRA